MQLSTDIVDRESALAYLYGRIDYERITSVPYLEDDFKLDRMRELLERLGNPQAGLPIVHLAGTKGKGSTAAMIASVLLAAGYRTGLYTSPHLQGLEERFALDGANCTPAQLVELTRLVRPVVDEMDRQSELLGTSKGPTYFEITTAMALLFFTRAAAEAAVLEVGMGGRLDSTNVCQPRISVVTTISYDHTKQLGNTLAAIAAEKAGIIKSGIPVVTGVVEPEPRNVISRIARDRGARLYALGDEFDFTYEPAHAGGRGVPSTSDGFPAPARIGYWECVDSKTRRFDDLSVGLLGRHQAANAAVALATLGRLAEQGWNISEPAIRAGLAAVRCPARVEIMSRRPTVIIDVAHNTAAIEALGQVLDESFPRDGRILVFAASRDKDVRGMLRLILPRFDHVIFTRFLKNPRSAEPETLFELADSVCREQPSVARLRAEISPDPLSAWRRARELAAPEHLICVTGSFFIAAEVQAVLAGEAGLRLPPFV